MKQIKWILAYTIDDIGVIKKVRNETTRMIPIEYCGLVLEAHNLDRIYYNI